MKRKTSLCRLWLFVAQRHRAFWHRRNVAIFARQGAPGPETALYYGLNTAYALGQVLFALLALLAIRNGVAFRDGKAESFKTVKPEILLLVPVHYFFACRMLRRSNPR